MSTTERRDGETIASVSSPFGSSRLEIITDLGGDLPHLEFSVYVTGGKGWIKLRQHFPVSTYDLRAFAEEILRKA